MTIQLLVWPLNRLYAVVIKFSYFTVQGFSFRKDVGIKLFTPNTYANGARTCAIVRLSQRNQYVGLPGFDPQIRPQGIDSPRAEPCSASPVIQRPPIFRVIIFAFAFLNVAAKARLQQTRNNGAKLRQSDEFIVGRAVVPFLTPMDAEKPIGIHSASKIRQFKITHHGLTILRQYTSIIAQVSS